MLGPRDVIDQKKSPVPAEENKKLINIIMTTKTPKAVKATLSFSADFQVSFQTAEAKWMQLANGQRDPNEKGEDEAELVIQCLCEDIAVTVAELFSERISSPVWVKGLLEDEQIEVTNCELKDVVIAKVK